MSNFIKKTAQFLLIWVPGTLIGKGLLSYIHNKGYYPEKWVEGLISKIEGVVSIEPIIWVLSGLFGLTFYIFEIRYKWLEGVSKKKTIETINQDNQTHEFRDWSIRDALEWWVEVNDKVLLRDGIQFFDILEQLALDGEIMVWGRPNNTHQPWEKIESRYWRDYEFDGMRYIYIKNNDEVAKTSTEPRITARVNDIKYFDLRVTSRDIKQKWPPLDAETFDLSLHFIDDVVPMVDAKTGQKLFDSKYVHVCVKPKKNIENCTAHLTSLLKRDDEGNFNETEFRETLQLPWSHGHGKQDKQLVLNVDSYVDIVQTISTSNKLILVDGQPTKMANTFDEHTTYRFKIQVNGGNTSKSIEIDVIWTGKWDEIKAKGAQNVTR